MFVVLQMTNCLQTEQKQRLTVTNYISTAQQVYKVYKAIQTLQHKQIKSDCQNKIE